VLHIAQLYEACGGDRGWIIAQWHVHWGQGRSTSVSTWMGDHEGRPGAVNLHARIDVKLDKTKCLQRERSLNAILMPNNIYCRSNVLLYRSGEWLCKSLACSRHLNNIFHFSQSRVRYIYMSQGCYIGLETWQLSSRSRSRSRSWWRSRVSCLGLVIYRLASRSLSRLPTICSR